MPNELLGGHSGAFQFRYGAYEMNLGKPSYIIFSSQTLQKILPSAPNTDNFFLRSMRPAVSTALKNPRLSFPQVLCHDYLTTKWMNSCHGQCEELQLRMLVPKGSSKASRYAEALMDDEFH